MERLTGSQLGPYEIGNPLGSGGMGEVYRAKDPRLKREVAVKILSTDFLDNDSRRRFQREAEAASALNHPNILSIYDIGIERGRNYIVSELVEGESLRKIIRKGSISTKKLLDYAVQIADGLAAAHQAGIVHRDLKPENIMITTEGRIKILDFGLAKLFRVESASRDAETISRPLTETGIIQGTVPYMSPEQAKGSAVDFRSDQFSFGSILYEVATGKRPFRNESVPQTLSAIISEEPESISELNPKLPAPVRWLIERCLSKDSQLRYDSTRDLYRDLKNLHDHLSETSSETVVDSSTAIAPKRKRQQILAIAIAALFAGLLATTIHFYIKSSNSNPLSYHRLTYQRGYISGARFTPDGQTIVYSAAFQGNPNELYLTRTQGVDSRPLGIQDADILSISQSGKMAILLRTNTKWFSDGILAEVPLSGGAPHQITDNVWGACYTPDGTTLAVAHRVSNTTRIELPLGNVLYETPLFIRELRISRDGKLISFNEHATTNAILGSVIIIDRNGKKIASTSTRLFPEANAWLNSDEIWISSSANEAGGGSELYSLSASGKQRVLQRFPHAVLHDIGTSHQILLSFDESRNVTVASLSGQTEDRDLSWLDGTSIADISHDGKVVLLWETGEGTNDVVGSAYLRKTDGSPAVLLGAGVARNMSQDGKFALVSLPNESRVVLLPTGAGETKSFDISQYRDETTFPVPTLFPDGRHILFLGIEKGHRKRVYIQDVSGGTPRAITEEDVECIPNTISPDGQFFIGRNKNNKTYLYPIESGSPREISGISTGETPFQWNKNGSSIYVFNAHVVPVEIYGLTRFDGKRELVRKWNPSDRAGINEIFEIRMTPDEKNFVYSYSRTLSTLYQITGLN